MNRGLILLVDGDNAHRDLLAGFLRDAGYEVLAAPDGAKGWKIFQDRRPDIVVLDMLLPDVSGSELRRKIERREEGSSPVPVILMSDFTQQAEWITEPLPSEAACLTISKPVSRKELLGALSGLKNTCPSEISDPRPPGPATGETSPEAVRRNAPGAGDIVAFPDPGRRSGPWRLLLADDNPVTGQIIRRAFDNRDFLVEIAADGKEVASTLDGPPPDIVLLDVNLRGRNGFDIFDLIRRNSSWAGTAVVFLIEPYEKIDDNRLKARPAEGVIRKPLKSADWVRKVKDVLDKGARRSSRL